jgi:hypothetical protein
MYRMRQLQRVLWSVLLSLTAAGPITAPDSAPPPQTGDITLNFTQRSPLSSRKEIARRLALKESDLADDYDLTTYPFKAYIPPNYDPSTPYGVFVYLGIKDVNDVAVDWEGVFDKSHMIFITPYYHNNGTREWHLIGLGFDAIENLKRLYNIDTHRLYEMWNGSGIDLAVAGADVYSGMIIGENWDYFRRIDVGGGRYHPAACQRPPSDLLQKAMRHGVVLITSAPIENSGAPFIAKALKEDGFTQVLSLNQTRDEMHFPHFAASWISDPVLPFLDKARQKGLSAPTESDEPVAAAPPPPVETTGDPSPSTPSTRPAASPPAPSSRPTPSVTSNAEHLLSLARLYIQNGNTELARTKLKAILTAYPKDPAAIEAKKLLDSLPPPPQ